MVFPWIHFPTILPKGGAATLSDIMFLAVKEYNGGGTSKLFTDEGTLSATGDLASITASSGKDLYLAKAKVSARHETGATGTATGIVELKANGTIVATWAARLHIPTGTSANSVAEYEFAVSGIKVAATEIIKLEAVTVDANLEVNGELVCWEETTGADPAI